MTKTTDNSSSAQELTKPVAKVDQDEGKIARFQAAIGVTSEELDALRARLVASNAPDSKPSPVTP